MQECVVWVWRLLQVHKYRFRERSEEKQLAEYSRRPSRCIQNVAQLPPHLHPEPLGESKMGNVCTVPDDEGRGTDTARSRAGRGGYGGPEGEVDGGGCRCAARWSGEDDGRKHKKLLFGEKRHERSS